MRRFPCDGNHRARAGVAVALLSAALLSPTAANAADACAFEPHGQALVTRIVDARSLLLDDGREILLAGVEALDLRDTAALSRLALSQKVTITARAGDDAPDRYGRQHAFVLLGEGGSLQARLLSEGAMLRASEIADAACLATLTAAEAAAREARRGLWRHDDAIKRAANPDGILTRIGRFAVVEGRVASVRESGGITYVNFGARWTKGFAVTISRRDAAAIDAETPLKTIANRRVRVRGMVEGEAAPRIAVRSRGQIEVLDDGPR